MSRQTRTKKPDPISQLERQLQVMPEDYLLCRELRHAWGPYTAAYMRGQRNVIERTLQCKRCKGRKDQQISGKDGSILWSGQIEYPEGYLFTGVGRITSETMGVIRLASITHQLVRGIQVDA